MPSMTQPNFVFILIDDLGWRDLACFGSSFYETPHLDRLARQGLRFTDAYAACPVCSPTRASLLTGRYPARIGLTDWIDWGGRIHPARGQLVDVPYVRHLPLAEVTSASRLRTRGYRTWHVGKWHLGTEDAYPERHGFDVNVGGCYLGSPGAGGYFSPYAIPGLPPGPPGEYLTDRLTDEALALIRQRDDRPFFLNLWYYAVHTPIQAKADKIEKYRAKARALGLDRQAALEEGEFFPTEHKRHLRVTRRVRQSDPAYAAMVESMDENVGRILAALEDEGLADNTLVLFASDNGGLSSAEGSPTCNAPLAEGKGWMYEGGTRTPFLAYWPGRIAAGAACSAPVCSIDVFPTLTELAGLAPEPSAIDGASLVPLLRGATRDWTREALFWHYPHYGNQGGTPGSSVRAGDYKLIEFYEDGRLELYNLADDVGETCNLAEAEPAQARHLHDLLRAWRHDVAARYPQRNPHWPDGSAQRRGGPGRQPTT